jgi:hypothetical protein
MTRRRVVVAGVFLSAILLAFILRDMVVQLIIVPLAYLWWLLRLYYSMIPQYILWGLLVVVAIYSAMTSLMPEISYRRSILSDSKLPQGQIELLVEWLNKSQRGGSYYKWLVANRFGKNAREILAQRDGSAVSKKFGRLEGRGWNPSQIIRDYLETGLNGSFADFPRPSLPWITPAPTPLDADPMQVIDYLENEMETSHDGNRKGI